MGPWRWAAVAAARKKRYFSTGPPMRHIFVPHSGQVPLVMRRLFLVTPSTGSTISRFSLHFTQYAIVFSAISFPFFMRLEAFPTHGATVAPLNYLRL